MRAAEISENGFMGPSGCCGAEGPGLLQVISWNRSERLMAYGTSIDRGQLLGIVGLSYVCLYLCGLDAF